MVNTLDRPAEVQPHERDALTALALIRSALPVVDYVSEDEFRSRHRAVMAGAGVATALAVSVALVMVWRGENDNVAVHLVADLAAILVPALWLSVARTRLSKALAGSAAILGACVVLVHFTNGLIESHFSFFVFLPLIALYADWRPYAFAVFHVAGTHGLLGVLDPTGMYNHEAAINSPVMWGIIHAAYVLMLSSVMLVHWYFGDRRRLRLEQALVTLEHTQDRLVQAEKLESIGSLAAGVAHEINTPVQFVRDNLAFISDSVASYANLARIWAEVTERMDGGRLEPDAIQRMQAAIEEDDIEYTLAEVPLAVQQSIEGVDRVAEIVRAMKGFSHPSNEIVPSDVNRIVADTTTVSRNEWKYIAELELDLDPSLPFVPLAPGSFSQVILNMLVNAAHAIEQRQAAEAGPGRITVRTSVAGNTVSVAISDNGAGISEEYRSRVFDQFFTTKEPGKGTGQGLALAASFVHEVGGWIDLDSTLGEGTTFTINLPIDEPVAVGL